MADLFKNKKLEMLEMYEDAIARGKDKTFAIYQLADGKRVEVSFNDIKAEANYLIDKLQKAGLKKGDRIAVISSLRPWWFALTYACLKAGYVMVCIDPGVPASQVQDMMLQTEVRAVFTTLKVVLLPYELKEHVPIYSIEAGFPLISKTSKVSHFLDNPKSMPDGTFFILFSSGTTAEKRKAVLLKTDTVTKGIEYGMSTDSGVYKKKTVYVIRQRDLMLFPPYHIAGLLCATFDFYCNTQIIMLERLTPNALVKALDELKPDNICTVPSMLSSLYKKIVTSYDKNALQKITINFLLTISRFFRKSFGIKAGRFFLSSINKKAFGGNMKGFMIGASPFDEKPNRYFLDMGLDVNMAYGLTELGAPLTSTGQGYYPGTAGRVVKHTKKIDIRIVNKDENGRGEVEVLSPYRMISYLNPKDNEGIFTEDGYFKTGDLGYYDSNNCLVISGRSKESIVLRNGEKLLPEEIESKYQNVDSIRELVAFKVPGEGGCDDFSIAVTTDNVKGIPDEALKVRVFERAGNLPQMYRPKDVYVLRELPLSSTHKVQRFRLTEMVLKGNNEPITDGLMIPVDEDEVTNELRKILIEVGGSQWKTQKLSQGLLLNLDSLSTVNLYVAIQDKWSIDLFQTSTPPVTFGELLDIVKNFDTVEKNNRKELDLSKYPLPVSRLNRVTFERLEHLVKRLWRVKSYGVENFPTDTNYIICSNHRTDIDPAFICASLPHSITRKTCIVGKSDLITNKIFKELVVSHNFIPVDRTGNSIQTLKRCEELLNEGWNILIFPEGTSIQNNTKLLPLKEGAAKLAIATGKPIVPAHITGVAHQKKEMNEFRLPSLSGKITIKYGKHFYPENMNIEELNKVLATKIEELD